LAADFFATFLDFLGVSPAIVFTPTDFSKRPRRAAPNGWSDEAAEANGRAARSGKPNASVKNVLLNAAHPVNRRLAVFTIHRVAD